jgi:ligand-binding sensor domain-containing protein/two-component sensor histidine kinase
VSGRAGEGSTAVARLARTSAAGTLLLAMIVPLVADAQQVPFRSYTVSDGLVDESVRTVFQDSQGFLWFGTDGGVSRFDGATFRSWKSPAGDSETWVNRCAEDSAGNIWFACGGAGLIRYAEGSWFRYPAGSDGELPGGALTVFGDRAGSLWVGARGLSRWDGAGFRRVATPSLPNQGAVWALLEDRAERIWVGSDGGLVALTRRGGEYVESYVAPGMRVYALAEDSTGTVWVGTDRGIERVRNTHGAAEFETEGAPRELDFLRDTWIRSLDTDDAGTVWIGTNGQGVVRLHRDGSVARYEVKNGLAGNNVLDVLQDREGSIWLATTTGASELVNEDIQSFTVRDGLVHNLVMCLVEGEAGTLWAGTAQGVSRISGGTIRNSDDGYGLGSVFTLFGIRDRRGRVWIGSETGPSVLAAATDCDRFKTYGPSEGWSPTPSKRNRARTILQDREGWIWFGNDWGVSVLVGDSFKTFARPQAPDSLVSAIVRDDGGDLWVGFHSGGGIVRFAVFLDGRGAPVLEEVARYGPADGIADGQIRCGIKDAGGALWFGTRAAGAYRFVLDGKDVASVYNLSTSQGLPSNYVRAIFEDREHKLWFGTDGGVSRLEPGPQGKSMFKHISMTDGLPGNDVNFICEDAGGVMWFATSNGVARYAPSSQPARYVSPPVYLTEFSVLGEPDSSALRVGRARLGPEEHSVSFEFVGLSYRHERETQYRYMLEGVDAGWTGPSDRRYAAYTHLPPGRYKFKVIAGNSDGAWSTTPATFDVTVAAPVWRRAWFILFATSFIGTGALGIHRYRIRRAVEVERIRSKIAADLHDDIGSTLSSISILSEMARLETSEASVRRGELLERIGRSSRAMLEAMNDIIWTVSPDNDSVAAVVQRMRGYASELLPSAGIEWSFEVRGELAEVRVSMEARRDLYLLYKEALNNALKHSRCRSIAMEIMADKRRVTLAVRDDGIGFDVTAAHGGHGLGNIRRRADNMRGQLIVESSPGRGTTITTRIPA